MSEETTPKYSALGTILLKASAAIVLGAAFMPLSRIFGKFADDRGNVTPTQWLLGICIVVIISILIAATMPADVGRFFRQSWSKLLSISSVKFVITCLAVLAGELLLISQCVFNHRPLLVDSVVQLFQAKIFAGGMIAAPRPKYPEFFMTQHMLFDGTGWYSQYPPGHSMLLSAGVGIGLPWLIDPLLGVLTALSIYLLARKLYAEQTARCSLLLCLICPFFLFMSASFMNHVSTALFVTLAVLAFAKWEESLRTGSAVACGTALGAAFLSRPLCALTIAAVLLLFSLKTLIPRKLWRQGLAGAAGFAFFAAQFLLYNYLTTGDAFLPGYIKLWGDSHGLGFHQSPWGVQHTPLEGLANQLFNFAQLNEFLFEWAIPCSLPIAAWLIFGSPVKWDRRLFWLFICLPGVYFFYWHRDSYLGPRFLYAGIPMLLILTARAFGELPALAAKFNFKLFPSRPPLSAGLLIKIVLALNLIFTAALGLPMRFRIYSSGMTSMKDDLPARAAAQHISSGLIFIPVAWGSRILSLMRAMDVSASDAEIIYRQSDHCLLDAVVKEAWAGKLPRTSLAAAMRSAAGFPVQKIRTLNQDPTLRLRPNIPLTETCREEIEYDRRGYGLFLPLLPVNDPRLAGPLVFAADLRDHNQVLMQEYPELPVYIYRAGKFEKLRDRIS